MGSNPLRGQSTLEAGGTTYKLVLDVNAFCQIQPVLKMKPLEIVQAFTDSPDDLVVPRAVLWGALQRHHECSLWDAGDIMAEIGLVEVRSAVSECMAVMFGIQAEGKDNADPTHGKTTPGTG